MTANRLFAWVALLALAGCTGGRAEETARLRIIVRSTSSAPPQVASLSCGASTKGTGFLADKAKAEAACAALEGNRQAGRILTQGPPAGRVCTQVFGGPQVARITGSLRGRVVDRSFTRANGCEIADWDALVALLGEPGGGPEAPR